MEQPECVDAIQIIQPEKDWHQWMQNEGILFLFFGDADFLFQAQWLRNNAV